jgi:hypothetical protein
VHEEYEKKVELRKLLASFIEILFVGKPWNFV